MFPTHPGYLGREFVVRDASSCQTVKQIERMEVKGKEKMCDYMPWHLSLNAHFHN
jgi:hypothetical protein